MHRSKRTTRKSKRVRLISSRSDGPPTPSDVDIKIAHNKGRSVAIEATNENLQAFKNIPTPSLSETIEQRTRENGRLRQELAYEHRKHAANKLFLEKVRRTIEHLQLAVIDLDSCFKEIENGNRPLIELSLIHY